MELVLKQDKRSQIKPPPTKQQQSSNERRYSSKTQHLEKDKSEKTEPADLHERVKSSSLVRDLKPYKMQLYLILKWISIRLIDFLLTIFVKLNQLLYFIYLFCNRMKHMLELELRGASMNGKWKLKIQSPRPLITMEMKILEVHLIRLLSTFSLRESLLSSMKILILDLGSGTPGKLSLFLYMHHCPQVSIEFQ